MLEVNQLTRCYGHFTAVDDVSFNINKGEITGLLGHNGAGKTTIMKMLSGYLEPHQGDIRLDGLNLVEQLKGAQQHLGYLPESLPVYPELSVADFLDYAASLKSIPVALKSAEIKRVVEATDIGSKFLAPIATLSRGYKQRVGVAQALLGKPRLLILDEPTNGLDPTQTQYMRQLIRDIAKEATVILSTHILQEVEAVCSRVLILQQGKKVLDTQLSDLQKSHQLRLATTMTPELIHQHIRTISGVEGIEQLENADSEAEIKPFYQYRLTLNAQRDMRPFSADLAKTIMNTGADLFLLQPEQRNLEALFKEFNQVPQQEILKEGASHAA